MGKNPKAKMTDPFASFLLKKAKKGEKDGAESDETPEQQADDAQPVDEGEKTAGGRASEREKESERKRERASERGREREREREHSKSQTTPTNRPIKEQNRPSDTCSARARVDSEHGQIAGAKATRAAMQHAKDVALAHRGPAGRA